jgi:hypothetical protein
MRKASLYEKSGELLYEQRPQFVLEDGTAVVSGDVIKLSDGTYALVENTGDESAQMVDEHGHSIYTADVVFAPDVTADGKPPAVGIRLPVMPIPDKHFPQSKHILWPKSIDCFEQDLSWLEFKFAVKNQKINLQIFITSIFIFISDQKFELASGVSLFKTVNRCGPQGIPGRP